MSNDRGPRIGVLVNPTAGLGGSVGLKGTDGVHDEALRRGAIPRAPVRAVRSLRALARAAPGVTVVAAAGEMGTAEAQAAGLPVDRVLPVGSPTTADDTRRAARSLLDHGVDLLLVVGGDGTAADVYTVVGQDLPVLGVPAGVKMQSAIFAQSPEAAGLAAGRFVTGVARRTAPRELLDLDEELLRQGTLSPRLIGYLQVPEAEPLLQNAKRRAQPPGRALAALGLAVAETLGTDRLIAVGPGATAGAVLRHWGLPHTLLGFDLVIDRRIVAADVAATELERHARELHVVVAPIGGQGFLFGRGNQQLTPELLRAVGPERLTIVATADRLAALHGQPLLVDVDVPGVEQLFVGTHRVLTGLRRWTSYPVASPHHHTKEN